MEEQGNDLNLETSVLHKAMIRHLGKKVSSEWHEIMGLQNGDGAGI